MTARAEQRRRATAARSPRRASESRRRRDASRAQLDRGARRDSVGPAAASVARASSLALIGGHVGALDWRPRRGRPTAARSRACTAGRGRPFSRKCESRLRRQAEDADVRKGDRRQRDEGVAEEVQRRDALARQQRRRSKARRASIPPPARNPPMPRPITTTAMAPNDEEEDRLKRVDPRGAAHAAEEHVAHHHERHDRAAEPERHQSTADALAASCRRP